LVANSIPDLSADRVTVVLVASTIKAPQQAGTVSVWGMAVPPVVAPALRNFGWLLIGGIVLALGALVVLAVLLWRSQRTARSADGAA